MNEYTLEKLRNIVISDIKVKKEKNAYGIAFLGLPGIGKTTVANLLAKKLDIEITSNDKIRRLLDNIGIDSKKNQKLVEQLSYARCEYLLKNHMSVIIDANALNSYQIIEEKFKENHIKIFFIKLECDENIIVKRLLEREKNFDKDSNNYSKASKEFYFESKEKYKDVYFPEEKIFYTINTENNIDEQLDELVNSINKSFEI